MRPVSRYRLPFLGIVNAVILFHVIAYYAFDRKAVGCVDFFGLATFLGNGQVTAGTLFLGAILLLTLLLGRVFCGWGCHFALFQDLLVRLLTKLGIQPPVRRSRLEIVLPPVLFMVTLAYPIIAWWRANGRPYEVSVDLSYPEVWHLLPGLKGVILILVIDVVVLTLLFGTRAFCRFICPYGLMLKVFHALSPVRVVKTNECSDCGACARSCPTGVAIKFEIENFGAIRDLNCMNCGDCVAACPSGALTMRPTWLAYANARGRVASRVSSPLWTELVLLATAVAGLFLYRGREYGDFLSVGLGLVVGGLIVVSARPNYLIRAAWVKRWPSLRVLSAIVATYLFTGLVAQGLTQRELARAGRAVDAKDYPAVAQSYSSVRRIADAFGVFTFYLDDADARARRSGALLVSTGDELMRRGDWVDAEHVFRAVLSADPTVIRAHGDLGTSLAKQGRYWEAARCYLKVLEFDPDDLVALYHLAMTWIQLDRLDDAEELVIRILDIDTVGNAHNLIANNPLFHLLDHHPRFRHAMSIYRPRVSGTPATSGRKP